MRTSLARDQRSGRRGTVEARLRLRQRKEWRLRPNLMVLEERTLLAAPETLTVSNTNDSGTGSLRQAILIANANAYPGSPADTIVFSSLFNSHQTITLTSGQLELSNGAVQINGPAAGVTVSAGGNGRVFKVDTNVTASISGLTITGGNVNANNETGPMATIFAPNGGGLANYGTATLTNCTVSGNSSAVHKGGGGVYTYGGLNVGNPAATTNLIDCTISGNTAYDGGGVGSGTPPSFGPSSGGKTTLTNCTVYGNSAHYGGGICDYYGAITLAECTVSGNFANAIPGPPGIYLSYIPGSGEGLLNRAGTCKATNTIIAGNSTTDTFPFATPPAGDVTGNITGSNNLIGGNPLLSPLGNYGGRTQTMQLLNNSPAIGAGGVALIPSGVTTDQRGNPRTTNGTVDIGALQFVSISTSVFVTSSVSGTIASGQPVTFTAEVVGASTPIGSVSFVINGQSIPVGSPSSTSSNTSNWTDSYYPVNSGPATQTYTVQAVFTGTGFNATGAFTSSSGSSTQTFSPTLLVTNTNALGSGSLPYEVSQANAFASFVPIVFNTNPALGTDFSTPQTIDVLGSGLQLTNTWVKTTITGPAAPLTILGLGGIDVFQIDSGVDAYIAGLTISGGGAPTRLFTTLGNGIDNLGTLHLTDCTLSGNSASVKGGGLYNPSGSTAYLTDDTIANNAVLGNGGGVYNAGKLTLTNCTVSGNSASGNGGGLYNNSGNVSLYSTIVAGNTITSSSTASDIAGSSLAQSSFNLIGTGGSGGLVNGNGGNIVLTGTASPGVGPLGWYGGPSQTMALVAGSPAIGHGTSSGLLAWIPIQKKKANIWPMRL